MYLLTCAPNEDSNQSVHPHSLMRVFVVRMKKFLYPWQSKIGPVKLLLRLHECDANLNLRWAHMFVVTFLLMFRFIVFYEAVGPNVMAVFLFLHKKQALLKCQAPQHIIWSNYRHIHLDTPLIYIFISSSILNPCPAE